MKTNKRHAAVVLGSLVTTALLSGVAVAHFNRLHERRTERFLSCRAFEKSEISRSIRLQ